MIAAKNPTIPVDIIAAVVGKDGISTDASLLEQYSANHRWGGVTPELVVRPANAAQVRDIVTVAKETGINLVLSSSGPPHQLGGTLPMSPGLIVDMAAMDQIVRLDRRNKMALVEPGVTFPKLIEAADREGLKVLMPLLPREGKSVLGSYLEREPILTPKYHWDMTDPMLCSELVFGTGDVFRTGSAAGPGTLEQQWATGLAQKNPMGPAQTDLVRIVQGAQGTMAAMTWATIKLEVKPVVYELAFACDKKLSRLVEFSYKVLRPKLGEEYFILNARALAAVISEDKEDISRLAARQSPYTVIYGVAGYEYFPGKRVAYQQEDIARIAQAAGVKLTREVPGASANRIAQIIAGTSGTDSYKARPKGAYQDIFFLTTLDRTPSFIRAVEELAVKHGYRPEDLGIYIQPVQHGRTCHLEFTLYYDPADDSDTARAMELFSDASDTVSGMGAFFSRPYGPWADLAFARCPDTVKALRKVKKMLDPAGVLNRGKLCFEEV
ncbi:MAG: FAD-binding oxidoreductase [Candidatus Geothermincolia bacterium]